jgi:hypothetical protein
MSETIAAAAINFLISQASFAAASDRELAVTRGK